MRLLIVEDDEELNNVLVKRLKTFGFDSDSAFDGIEALEFLDVYSYDIIIMDIMMPRMNGFDTVKKLRERKINTPVIFLSAKDTDLDIVKGLEFGADDYLIKPFSFEVLVARIKVLIRRNDDSLNGVYKIKDLEININSHEVKRGDRNIVLSNKEFELLLLLIRNKNTILSRNQIHENLYGIDNENESNVVDVHIRNLRKKIDDDFSYKIIETKRSVGYIIRD